MNGSDCECEEMRFLFGIRFIFDIISSLLTSFISLFTTLFIAIISYLCKQFIDINYKVRSIHYMETFTGNNF